MKILVVEDDPIMQATLKTVFRDYEVSFANSFDEAISLLEKVSFQVAFLDVNLKAGTVGDGIDVLQKIRERDGYLPCVMISGVTDKNIILRCLDYGAVDYLIKADGTSENYRLALHKALMWRKLFSESTQTRNRSASNVTGALLGQSEGMQALRETIAKAGRLDGPFLVLGETGTGKELVARALWAARLERNRPFIAVNCAGLPENLVESELFGYERGAFTGALTTKTGLFEAANGGDIFLDEIGELNTDLQAKLLRVLQEKKVRRLGSERERPVDFRVIAATNIDIGEAIERKEFRDDLFYRLNVHQIRIPNLRARRSDILPLLDSFLREQGLGEMAMTDRTKELLLEFPWPGNVRQLKAFSQYVIPYLDSRKAITEDRVLCWIDQNQVGRNSKLSSNTLQPEDELKAALRGGTPVALVEKLENIQKSYVDAALKLTSNNRSQAAKALGVSRQRLSNWLNDWDITS